MAETFRYKPRFVDIRIKPPRHEAKAEAETCEYPGCRKKAEARAPKSPTRPGEYYQFCQAHAADYNKSWDFFEGMGEGARRTYYEAEQHGHRPTWNFSRGSGSRKRAERASVDWQEAFFDPYKLFGDRPPPNRERFGANAEDARRRPRPGRLQSRALETLGLEPGVEKAEVRKRYSEMLKRYHPDSNGGDRAFEDRLQKVVAAYQILKQAGLA